MKLPHNALGWLKRLILGLVVLEGGAFVGLSLWLGEVNPWEALDRSRAATAQRAAAIGAPAGQATSILVPHPYHGFAYNPSFDPAGMLALHSVGVSEWGFLDDKSPLQKADTRRLVVGITGGSMAFWMSVQGIARLVGHLSKVPQFAGKQIVIVRLALGGFKQPQQAMVLSELLSLGGHFDVLVNLDGFNEAALGFHPEQDSFPFLPRDWATLVATTLSPSRSRLIGEVSFHQAERGDLATLFSRTPLRQSPTAGLVWLLADRRVAQRLSGAQDLLDRLAGSDQGSSAQTGPRRRYASEHALAEDLAAVWRDSSLTMHHLCAGRGIRYFHFLQPNQYVSGSKTMGPPEAATALAANSRYERGVRATYPLLLEAGRDLVQGGVAFSDPTLIYRTVPDPLYIYDCCHVSARGNELLADAIGMAIRDALAEAPAGR